MRCGQLNFVAIVIFTICACQYAYSGESVDLAGRWQFAMDPNDEGVSEKWFEKEFDESINLPGSMTEAGFGDDVTVDTKWTGGIVDRGWFTQDRFEKYRQLGNIKIPFWLVPNKHYVGPAWYQRVVSIPRKWSGKRVVLKLERTHWNTQVWVNGKSVGIKNSLGTPNEFDISGHISPGDKNRLSIRVNNTIKIPVGENAHSVSDHTQTNWNGIIGDMKLYATDKVWLDDVQVYPDVKNKVAKVKITLGNGLKGQAAGRIKIKAECGWTSVPGKSVSFENISDGGVVEIDYPMGDDVKLWDEFDPSLYEMILEMTGKTGDGKFKDLRKVKFGMRQISKQGLQVAINGNKIYLRGTLECCIFPLTGYPPTDVESWKRIIRICKAHGLNHIRFHSWCPPEAAFIAADEMGFYLQAETSAWASVGVNAALDKWLYDEGKRMLKAYGNHPSFILMAYGNEPGGNTVSYLSKYVVHFKNLDSRRLYTSAGGWPEIPENDYHNLYGPRIQGWGQGLNSRINAKAPETITDYRKWVTDRKVPIVSHEIGQWCVYPNFKEIKKYTGVTRATNFELFQEDLANKHMGAQAEDFLMASGKLQVLCYKEEIEAALRTEGFGGFQLLDLHDFPGQGTALVGVLDAFWDEKGYITAKEFHRFSCETVPLARVEKMYWLNNETFTAQVQVSHFGEKDIDSQAINWALTVDGKIIANGNFNADLARGNLCSVGTINADLSEVTKASMVNVEIRLAGSEYVNDWDIFVFPTKLPEVSSDVVIVKELDKEAVDCLKEGKKVLLLADPDSVDSNVAIGFSSLFWNTAWTRWQAPHTLGVLCDPADALFADFPTEYHSNWQWWDLVSKSAAMIMDELPGDFRPKVQVIDTWFTNRKLGLVFEAKVGGGDLMVCSVDLESDMDKRPSARQFRHSLLKYMNSAEFAPKDTLELKQVRSLFTERFPGKVVGVSSESAAQQAVMLIDGNKNTMWHSQWKDQIPGYPHEVTIKLDKPMAIKGIKLLPRQDGNSNGLVKDIEVYLSDDGTKFSLVSAEGLNADAGWKQVDFGKEYTAGLIRLVMKSPQNVQHPWASFAELELIESEY